MNTPPTYGYRTDADRWRAVVERDPGAEGEFVLAVISTGIFCRPTCPARRPRRDRVEFYNSPAAARRAGYRACLRCKPEDEAYGRRHVDAITRATLMIRTDEKMPTLAHLANTSRLSPFHFHRLFKKTTGVTPRQYRAQIMLERAKTALRNGDSVTAAIYEAGYGSNSRFYEAASSRLGMAPAKIGTGGADESIGYAVRKSSLGYVLVATTAKGVCEVWLGDRSEPLVKRLREMYPLAKIASTDAKSTKLISKVIELVETPRHAVKLPLDVRGTAFEMRVWRALSRIPLGQTMTYGQIAAAIGHPNSARAVGRACARNHLAVVIPCHRAVGSDKELHGYRWGLKRKQDLLDRESATASDYRQGRSPRRDSVVSHT